MSFRNCTEVSARCPVEATVYGYYPNLGVNSALLAVFGVVTLAQITIGLSRRVYAYSAWVSVGCLLETLGYGGKLMLNQNPWSDSGNKLQIVCLILGPTFIAAGIYLTLKHMVLLYGSEYSRLRPNLYTWIFIGCDIGSICIQAVGGGLAASAGGNSNPNLLKAGNNIIMTGIAFQVATMIVCGVLAVEFTLKRRRGARDSGVVLSAVEKRRHQNANIFQFAVVFAYFTILIRCIYRLPEMAGGWGNPRMRNEKEFLILDGLMVALASMSLTLFHPGFFFPAMGNRPTEESKDIPMSSRDESDTGVTTPRQD